MASKEMLGGALDLFGWNELPDRWQFDLLGNRCTIRRGSSPRPAGDPKYFGNGTIPWIKIGDATKTVGRYIESTGEFVNQEGAKHSVYIPAGSLIIANSGVSLGFAAITRLGGCIHDGWLLPTEFRELDRDYLYYCINLVTYKIRNFADGTTQPNLNTDIARRLLLPMPPLAEQKIIAQILAALDDKIELNRRMNETLETIARALFKSWFVDFEPVRAKAEGRDSGLLKPIADLFPDSFEDSELGAIPKGWGVRVLEDVLSELETGGRPKGGVSAYATGTPSIGAESIVGLGVFDYSKTKYVPDEFFNGMNKGRIKSRDVLLYKDGGRPGKFEPHVTLFGDGFPFDRCAINEHVYRMRAKPELGQNLLFFWLSSDLVMEEMRIKGTGVAIPGLNSTQVKSLTTLVPTFEVAKAFDALVNPWINKILANCNESRILAALRDTLLPKLISGELRVKDAERMAVKHVTAPMQPDRALHR